MLFPSSAKVGTCGNQMPKWFHTSLAASLFTKRCSLDSMSELLQHLHLEAISIPLHCNLTSTGILFARSLHRKTDIVGPIHLPQMNSWISLFSSLSLTSSQAKATEKFPFGEVFHHLGLSLPPLSKGIIKISSIISEGKCHWKFHRTIFFGHVLSPK